jgi:polyisoprenoid-binding protein YceI
MNARHRTLALSSILVAGLSLPGAASAKLARAGGSQVSFTLVGPAGLKINGSGSDVKVSDDGQSFKVAVPLGTVTTGIDLRDEHMRKYLEVKSYPETELIVPRSALKVPGPGEKVNQDTSGSFTLHGKTKPMSFHYGCTREGDKLKVSGSLHLNMQDFGIEVPSYFGVKVKPDVDVSVSFDAQDG